MKNSNENLWKNNKNGKFYIVLDYNILNCTNLQDGEKMYLYKVFQEKILDDFGNELTFVRSEKEFKIKFTKI